MVKIPHAELGYARHGSGVKGRDKGEEIDRRIEQKTN